MKAEDGFASIHLKTDAEAPQRRMELAREVFGRQILRMDVLPLPDQEIKIDLKLLAMPGLKMGGGLVNGVSTPRTKSMLSDGNDDLFISLISGGRIVAEQRNREIVLEVGSFHLASNAEPVSYSHFQNDALALTIPRAAIASLVPNLDDHIAAHVPHRTAGVELLRNYLRLLRTSLHTQSPQTIQTIVSHVHDLIAHILGVKGDAREIVAGRGLKAARLQAIKTYIAAHLATENLSAGAVAARHQMSERYLQRLFETEETTFVTYVLNERLAHAHALLNDPRRRHDKISAIAYECGFWDVSHFNHMFKRRYGATPSEIRIAVEPERPWGPSSSTG